MSESATVKRPASESALPILTGLASVVIFFLVMELVIQLGIISRYIVPPPSEIAGSFYRIITEEHIVRRFLLTLAECFTAGAMTIVFGILGGVLMHRHKLLQQACETWVAAWAAAPIVLAYPLFMVIFGRNSWTIIMIGFVAALPPVILKTIEGMSGTRKVLVNVGRSFNLTPAQQFWKILLPAALPTIFVGVRLGLIFALINVVGVDKSRADVDIELLEAVAAAQEELGSQGRILLRPSGTEPLVRVMVEAGSHEQADAIASRLAGVVRDRLG